MKIIAIDFDGTIVSDEYPEIGIIKPGAKEVIKRLKNDGHYIIIWTCRTGRYMEQVKRWLDWMHIPYDCVNESNPHNVDKYGGTDTRKVYADVYIDDKGLIELPHWEDIYKMIETKIIK